MYSRDVVAEVIAANPIEDIVGAALTLQPAGSGRKKALCPFHQEKTPSFHVNAQRQVYHCFGCGKGGDVISFVMEHEGLTFMEAVRKLADRGGVRLPAASGDYDKNEYLRGKTLEFNQFAASWYLRQLHDPEGGAAARAYVAKRQLKAETLQRFGVGLAPEGWQGLADAGRAKGFAEAVLEASGLCKRGERGGLYDLFRNRVTFPIRDVSGNLVAFGGRDLGDSPAKYINSPETAVYKKSRVLFGLYEAREALRAQKRALLVEGYFDLLRCFDAGIENVVATCGTALTPGQAALIRRYVPEVVVVYDGDAAGIKAAMKASGVLTAAGLTVRAMALPGGQDPDDYIRDAGPVAFQALVAEAPHFITFYARHSRERAATIEGRTEVARELFEILMTLDDELRVDEYVKMAAKELGLNEYACRREFDKARRDGMQRRTVAEERAEQAAPPAYNPPMEDASFIAALLADPRLLAEAQAALGKVTLPMGPLGEVLALLLTVPGADARALEDEDARRLYTAAAAHAEAPADQRAVLVRKRVNRLCKEALRAEADAVQRAIAEAERGGNEPGRLAQLIARKIVLIRQMEGVEV
jgi:DNA primase